MKICSSFFCGWSMVWHEFVKHKQIWRSIFGHSTASKKRKTCYSFFVIHPLHLMMFFFSYLQVLWLQWWAKWSRTWFILWSYCWWYCWVSASAVKPYCIRTLKPVGRWSEMWVIILSTYMPYCSHTRTQCWGIDIWLWLHVLIWPMLCNVYFTGCWWLFVYVYGRFAGIFPTVFHVVWRSVCRPYWSTVRSRGMHYR